MLGITYALESRGLRIHTVTPAGPAEQAGLQKGDLIAEINGDALLFRDRVDALKWLERYKAGQRLELTVDRNGELVSAELLGSRLGCETALVLSRVLEAAEEGALEDGCAAEEESPPARSDGERELAFMKKFPATGGLLILTAGSDGVGISTDVTLNGAPLGLTALPSFMRDLADQLAAGESITLRIDPPTPAGEPPTIQLVSAPEHVKAGLGKPR